MVNTRSQKRRGMPKRATRKNLKNRNAQTKRRGQQKGGNPSNEEFRVSDEPLFASRNAVLGGDKIELKLNPNAIGNLVFDFDLTLTTLHSRGDPMIWVNNITGAFGGQLQELKIILGRLIYAGYNLFINSRGKRSKLIEFFKRTKLKDFIPENNIFGASDVKTRGLESINEKEPANSYAEVGIGGGRNDTQKWAKQKLRYLRRILEDTKNLPTKFYDDTVGNIRVVNDANIDNLIGIHFDPPGLSTTLGLLNELLVEEDPLPPLPPSAPPMSNNEQPPTPPRGTMALYLSVNNIKGNTIGEKYDMIDYLFKTIYNLINDPDKRILIDTKKYPKATSKLIKNSSSGYIYFKDETLTRKFNREQNMKNNKMHEKFITHQNIIDVLNRRTDKLGNINYKYMDDKLIVTYEKDGNPETKHLQDIIDEYLPPSYSNSRYNNRAVGNYPPPPPYSEGGRRKSKSNSKTRTKKQRSTKPKNKRTRKSKK